MKNQDFLLVSKLFGLGGDEVGGRALAYEDPRIEQKLKDFAEGNVPKAEHKSLISILLSKPELIAWFASRIKEANGETCDVGAEEASCYPYEVMPVENQDDEVQGHDGGDGSTTMVCVICSKAFPIRGTPLRERVYICPCGSHNLAGDETSSKRWQGIALPRITATFQREIKLDSVFLKGPDGSIYELPWKVAEAFKVEAKRRSELGHLPLAGRFSLDDDEVGGRHMTANQGAGGRPEDWTFHRTWEFGCYFSAMQNSYVIGYHRHPWGDERATGAAETDFS